MAEAFQFELVSPEALLLSEEVSEVTLPAGNGQMTVLSNHAATMSTVNPGVVTVKKEDGSTELIFVDGGFVEISEKGLSLLADMAEPAEELNATGIDKRMSTLEEALSSLEGAAKDAAETRLSYLQQVKLDLKV